MSESEGGSVHYVRLNVEGLLTGVGYFHMANDQLERFRRAVDDEGRGAEIIAISAALEKDGYSFGASGELKSAPRGYPRDHPRIELLRRKGMTAFKQWDVAPWLHTRAVVKRVRDSWNGTRELSGWLDNHVGPSTLPPPDFDR